LLISNLLIRLQHHSWSMAHPPSRTVTRCYKLVVWRALSYEKPGNRAPVVGAGEPGRYWRATHASALDGTGGREGAPARELNGDQGRRVVLRKYINHIRKFKLPRKLHFAHNAFAKPPETKCVIFPRQIKSKES
jgi:hypothetical protein